MQNKIKEESIILIIKQIKQKYELIELIKLAIISDRDLLKEIRDSISEFDFEKLKKMISQSHENTMNIYDNNINQKIKEDSLAIKDKIIKFIDFHKNQKEIDYNNHFFEDEIICNNFYKEVNDYSDTQIENNFSCLDRQRTVFHNFIYYKICFATNSNIIFANNNDLIEQIHEILSENKNRVFFSCGDKTDYIHNAISSNEFNPNQVIDQFINLEDIKLINLLINKYIGVEKSDYRGNALCFNKSGNTKRGPEIYYPPYGYLALGLKVTGKYEDDNWLNCKNECSEWMPAYHPIFSPESIKKIVENDLIPGDSQDKENQNDKRHPGNTIKRGIYLYPNIQSAEDKAKFIYFDNKKYKFVIMARVLIKKIMEPEDTKCWILEKQYVRIYRVLVKRY